MLRRSAAGIAGAVEIGSVDVANTATAGDCWVKEKRVGRTKCADQARTSTESCLCD